MDERGYRSIGFPYLRANHASIMHPQTPAASSAKAFPTLPRSSLLWNDGAPVRWPPVLSTSFISD
jgi:hypothetical protein